MRALTHLPTHTHTLPRFCQLPRASTHTRSSFDSLYPAWSFFQAHQPWNASHGFFFWKGKYTLPSLCGKLGIFISNTRVLFIWFPTGTEPFRSPSLASGWWGHTMILVTGRREVCACVKEILSRWHLRGTIWSGFKLQSSVTGSLSSCHCGSQWAPVMRC